MTIKLLFLLTAIASAKVIEFHVGVHTITPEDYDYQQYFTLEMWAGKRELDISL